MNLAKIYKGDCLDYLKKMDRQSVDCIVTDCPFGTNFKTDIYDDSKATIEPLIPQWYREWYRILKPSGYCFLYCGILNINVWIDEALKAGFDYRNMLAARSFVRGIPAKGNFCFELQPILVFSKGKGKEFNKVDFFPQSEAWKNDKRNTHPDGWTYAYSNWIPSEIAYATDTFGQIEEGTEYHPNAKSVKLERFLIEISTKEGDVVLDPFIGSGTTGVAALQCGRDFIGCELDRHWFEKAKERLEKCDPLFSRVEEITDFKSQIAEDLKMNVVME